MKRPVLLLFVACCLISTTMVAQQSAFVAHRQNMAVLPGEVSNLAIVDSTLYCFAADVLLQAQRTDDLIVGFWADTTYSLLADGIEYIVRHPSSGDIYFTARDKKGRSFLFRCDSTLRKVHRVKMGGRFFWNKGMTVEHPTFSPDGSLLIFSSLDGATSLGGYDLWYATYDGHHWSRPHNLSGHINTEGDEVTPYIYRDYLLFASNARPESTGFFSIYATNLVDSGSANGNYQRIGDAAVQRLHSPFNCDDDNDYDMVVDSRTGSGYWISHRNPDEGDSQIFSFSGGLDGMLLWGRVVDPYDHPLADVQVVARQAGRVICSTTSDDEGFYNLYLQANQYYELAYQLEQYFVAYEAINTTKPRDEYLIAEEQRNVRLDHLPLGKRIYFDDLFGPDADVTLSAYGKQQLQPLVQFLSDNPNFTLSLSLSNDLTNNPRFNALLTDQRLLSLRNYLSRQLPPTVIIRIHNSCKGESTCTGASGLSRLAAIIDKE